MVFFYSGESIRKENLLKFSPIIYVIIKNLILGGIVKMGICKRLRRKVEQAKENYRMYSPGRLQQPTTKVVGFRVLLFL